MGGEGAEQSTAVTGVTDTPNRGVGAKCHIGQRTRVKGGENKKKEQGLRGAITASALWENMGSELRAGLVRERFGSSRKRGEELLLSRL